MDSVKSLHQQLIEGRDNIVHSMVLHQGHMSAPSSWHFPVEVLSQIFIHCLPETNHLKVSSKLAPMLLTRICRHWRQVAVNIPSLWCRLSVEVADWSVVNWPQVAFCHCSWLERSRERQLSLAIQHSTSGAPMLQMLLRRYNARISSLQIMYDNAIIEPELLFQDLPTLHDLMLHWQGKYIDRSTISRSISRVPSTLRNLTVIGCFVEAFQLRGFSSSNGWAHMTSVDIAVYEPHEFLHLLCLCPNLSSLDILLQPRDNVLMSLELFTHSSLQSLRISCISRHVLDPLPALLNILILPNLRVLEARCTPESMWPHKLFQTFLARSKCPLESLIFGGGLLTTDEQRAEYTDLIPSLQVTIYPGHDDVLA